MTDVSGRVIFCMIVLAAMVGALISGGCATTRGVTADDFPLDIAGQCHKARAEALNNYTRHYGAPANIPPVNVVVTSAPPMGQGAITSGAGKGYRIEIWRDQRPFYGSLVHEFEHTLKQANGKGQAEGWP